MNTATTARPTTRIYEVTHTDAAGKKTSYLIDARSANAAEQHVARKSVGEASIATAKRIVELMQNLVKVEAAKAD